MRSKLQQLFLSLSSALYDWIALTETWLTPNHLNAELSNNNCYALFRKDRCSITTGLQRGGGVMLAVRSSYVCHQLDLPSSTSSCSYDIDQLIVKITFNKNSIVVIVSYIPPRSSFDLYATHVNNCAFYLSKQKIDEHVIILGDFNLTNLEWIFDPEELQLLPFNVNADYECKVIDSLSSYDLIQINECKNDFNNLLDLIFVDSELPISIDKSLYPIFPNSVHHNALDVHFSFYDYWKTAKCNNFKFNYSKANFEGISSYMLNIPWNVDLNNENLFHFYSFFFDKLKTAINNNVPKVIVKNNSKSPWYNKRLCNLRNRKSKAYKKLGLSLMT